MSELVDAADRFTQRKPSRPSLLDRGRAICRNLDVGAAVGLWLTAVAMLAYDSANGKVSLWSAWVSLVIGAAVAVTAFSWTTRRLGTCPT